MVVPVPGNINWWGEFLFVVGGGVCVSASNINRWWWEDLVVVVFFFKSPTERTRLRSVDQSIDNVNWASTPL